MGEERMMSPGEWNPSLLDGSPHASELRLGQFPPTPINTTDDFYNMEGNIIVQKSDIDYNSIISDASSTSSGSRRRQYRSNSRKEK